MKKTLSLLSLAAMFATMGQPALAAKQYTDFEAAKQQVTDDGYVVFIYPSGWDRYGEKLCKKLIADKGVQAAAGNAALLLAPIFQNRNDTTNAKARKSMGTLGYPGDMSNISYPAIIFYEKSGRMYATLHGEALMKASVKEVAELVKARMAAKQKQQELLNKSGATTDVQEKARLILASTRVDGVEWPQQIRETLKAVDPSDSAGCLAALNFGFGTQNGESMDDFLKRLDAVLDNKLLTPWQKQRACATAIGHIRRSYGSLAGGPLITKYGKAMHKLDPKSALGLSAPVIMRDWVKQYRYGHGWSDQVIPSAPIPMLMHDVPISKPGTYVVNFRLTTGRDGIRINRLRLMDGNSCVASYDEPREVTWGNTQQNYTFTVKKALKNPKLEITYGNEPNKRSSWGEITIKAQ